MLQRPRVVADRYRLVQQLGQGGMGRVWLAHDDLLHRDVAIKEIVPPTGLTPAERQEMRERTLREARAIARLSHPNVVRVFDVLSTDGDPWIVMEYVRGRSLQEVLATDGPLPVARVVDLGLGVLAALRAAHRAGVLHRDVKPGNVLLGEDGRVVLTDFGLATVPGDPVVTRTGLVLGSPAYLAPERARDGTAGPEADMWSLGATLYAAVEGQSPYARPSAMATLAALATEPPAPAKQAGPLRPVLNGLLRKNPAERISPEETERLLMRAIGRRSRRAPGRPLFPGVRLRRPPGPDTFAAAAGAAAASTRRIAASLNNDPRAASTPDAEAADATGTKTPDAARTEPEAADAHATEPEAADAPATEPKAADGPATEPKAAAPATEPEAADATATIPGEAAVPATMAHAEDAAQTDDKTPDAARTEVDREPPVPSPVDEELDRSAVDTVVPVVPGPRTATEFAKATAVAPVLLPGPATGAPRTHGGRRMWWWTAAAVGVVLAVVLVVVAVATNRNPEGERGKTGSTPTVGAGGAGAAAPSGTPTETAAPSPTAGGVTPTGPAAGGVTPTGPAAGGNRALPAGWRFYRDRTGFGVAVPQGWTISRRSTIVYFREPGGGRLLGIDQTDQPKPDPVADWEQQEAYRVAAGDWADYHRVKIVAVKYFVKAADWEFTYAATHGRQHVVNRGFITSPRQAYAIYWSTPDSQWSANLDNFQLIAQSFQPRS
jgi:eukaryotic-like serine/threonine-protein kinase